MTKVKWVWLSGPSATFVVGVDEDGLVSKPAPICWRWRLRPVQDVVDYFKIVDVVELEIDS